MPSFTSCLDELVPPSDKAQEIKSNTAKIEEFYYDLLKNVPFVQTTNVRSPNILVSTNRSRVPIIRSWLLFL